MNRYLMDFDIEKLDKRFYDVIIIGSGIAGTYTALNLPEDINICIISKGKLKECNSYLAQGGIAASILNDDRELHIKDTIIAGASQNNRKAVETLVYESENAINNLIKLGVVFDKDENNNFYRSLEGNHSAARILHVNGDSTGRGIMEVLIKQLKNRKNISIYENTVAVDLVTYGDECIGTLVLLKNKLKFLGAKKTVLASGGLGQLFSMTTNSHVLTGDGIAMAKRSGAEVENMEYIQFHPTALYDEHDIERKFLISEAVRGEGGELKNINGYRFMSDYDDRMELAPRDIVARAIFDQMEKTKSKFVYLDITKYDEKFLSKRFPMIFRICKEKGINIARDLIPVTPVAHYFMGGIKTDLDGSTSIKSLYAVGECACTGVHGANRLASNSLLEALVFGLRVSNNIKQTMREDYQVLKNMSYISNRGANDISYLDKKNRLKIYMSKYAGIVRTNDGLRELRDFILKELNFLDDSVLKDCKDIEIFNMYQVALLVVEAAINNNKNVGSHYKKIDL